MGFQAFPMKRLTQDVLDSLLLQQDIEFRAGFASTNALLHSIIVDSPESELLRVGKQELRSGDVRRRILGIRLVRELKRYQDEATAELADMLGRETDPDVIYWLVSAFGFLKSDPVTGRLRVLADHPDPGVRYHVATALANSASGKISAASVDALLALSRDENAEVRFSAIFELGSWWKTSRDPRIESALKHAILDDNDPLVRRVAADALEQGSA
jgi:hypothetical protein